MSPDGVTHVKIWKWALPSAIVICLIVSYWDWYFALFIFVGYLLHVCGFSPDLDLIGISRDESVWIKSIIFIPLVAMSTFYAKALQKFGSHRGFLSHGPFISSAIRLLFFGCPFVLIFRYYFADPLYVEFFAMWIGLSIADNWHIFFDWCTGELNYAGRIGAKSSILNWWIKKQFDFPSDETLRRRKNKLGHRGYYYEDEN